MKHLFLEARYNGKIKLTKKQIALLPKDLALFTAVQFFDSLNIIKKQLEDNGIKIKLLKGKHSKYKGQLLGCDVDNFSANNFLYIGDGQFHPMALLLKNEKPVFVYNPFTKKLIEFDKKDCEKIKKKRKGALVKFLSSKEIGILVTTKSGQNRLKDAQKLEIKLQKKGKNAYILISDTINFSQLENFPFIECFVNTACPRIAYDDSDKLKSVVNIDDVAKAKLI